MDHQPKTSIIKDSIGVTLASLFVILVNSILVTGLLSRFLLDKEFETYLFIRRWIAWVFPITTLSMGVGIKYFAAINDKSSNTQKHFLKASTFCLITVLIVLLLLYLSVPGVYAFMIPGKKDYSTLIPSLLIWLFGFSSYSILYSWFCGVMKIKIANLILVIFNALIPAGIILYFVLVNAKLSVSSFLGCWGIGYCISFILLLFVAGNLFNAIEETIASCRKLLKYSLPRIPAGFLVAFPAYFIAKVFSTCSIKVLPFLSGVMLFQLIHYATDPLGNVLMPRSARSKALESKEKQESVYGNIIEFFFTVAILILPQVAVWGAIILNVWLKTPIVEFKTAILYLAPAVIPIIMYVPIRSLLDAIEEKALTTSFLGYAMLVTLFVVTIFIMLGKYSLFAGLLAFCAGKYTFLILSLRAIRKRVRFNVSISFLFITLVIALLSGLFSYYLADPIGDSTSLIVKILTVISGGGIFAAISYLWLYKMRKYWLDLFFGEMKKIVQF